MESVEFHEACILYSRGCSGLYVQNRVRSLPTETPLKKPLFHKKVLGHKLQQNLKWIKNLLSLEAVFSYSNVRLS
jgi:hypothetical protein